MNLQFSFLKKNAFLSYFFIGKIFEYNKVINLMKMEENKDLQEEQNMSQEENTHVENQNTENTENLTEELSLEEQLAQQKDQYIRLYAEFENYKRRTQKEKQDFAQYANRNMMTSMLAILDDFERALKEISKSGDSENLKGIELIYNKFKNALIEKG